MRLLFLTGAGGSGTTTVAAATAQRAARSGQRVVLVTLDAESLGDVLGVTSHGGPDREPSGEPGGEPGDGHSDELPFAVRVPGGRSAVAELLTRGYSTGMLDQLGLDPLPPDLAGRVPGVEELAVLIELAGVLTEPWDLVVVDLGPLAAALRLFGGLDAVLTCARHMMTVGRRVDRAMTLPVDPLVNAVDEAIARLSALSQGLVGPATTIRVVTSAEPTAVRRVVRALPRLSLYGLRVETIVVNGSQGALPDLPVPVPRRQLPQVAPGPALGVAPWLAAHPAAGEALDPAPTTDEAGEPMAIVAAGPDFELTLRLPAVARGEVEAARLADELVVRVGEHTRVLTLASALRRCRVVGARLDDGAGSGSLTVRFAPDPALWRG